MFYSGWSIQFKSQTTNNPVLNVLDFSDLDKEILDNLFPTLQAHQLCWLREEIRLG